MTEAQASHVVALVVEAAAKEMCESCSEGVPRTGAIHIGVKTGLPWDCRAKYVRALATDEGLIRLVLEVGRTIIACVQTEVRREEREACANLVERFQHEPGGNTFREIAAAIRRGGTP